LALFFISWTELVSSESTRPVVTPEALTQEIHRLINHERIRAHLPPLSYDHRLAIIAKDHSIDMGRRNFFNHVNKAGEKPDDRAKKQGYSCKKVYKTFYTEGIGENIFQNNLYDSLRTKTSNGVVTAKIYNWNSVEEIARSTVTGWMQSPPHHKNIVEANYDRAGIGIFITPDYKVYITQNFC